MRKVDPEEVIYRIQITRNNNNRLWMDVLRLAFKHAPKKAAEIMKEITKNDKEISKWMGRL